MKNTILDADRRTSAQATVGCRRSLRSRGFTWLLTSILMASALSACLNPASGPDAPADSTGPEFIVSSSAPTGPDTLVDVVLNAPSGSVVTFAGDYTIVADGPLPATPAPTWIDIEKDITIDGAGRTVVIDAAEFGRHFTIRDSDTTDDVCPTLTLRNLTLRNGLGRNTDGSPANGGSIYNYRAGLILENVTIAESSVTKNTTEGGSGGAIIVDSGVAEIRSSTFEQNEAGRYGGAVLIINNSDVSIADSTFRWNSGGAVTADEFRGGGAIHVQDGSSLSVTDTHFLLNTSTGGDGGAIETYGPTDVINSIFERNWASGGGGGIFVGFMAESVNVHGSFFHANRANENGSSGSFGGGAIGSARTTQLDPVVTIGASVFVGNLAPWFDGGVLFLDSTSIVDGSTFIANSSGTAAHHQDIRVRFGPGISNSLIIGETIDDGTSINSSVSDADLSAFGSGNSQASITFAQAPDAGPDGTWGTADDNYGLLIPEASSAAIQAGDAGLIPSDILDLDGDGDTSEPWPYDIRGHARSKGTAPDVGAYEVQ